jgi:hypothetical protein
MLLSVTSVIYKPFKSSQILHAIWKKLFLLENMIGNQVILLLYKSVVLVSISVLAT